MNFGTTLFLREESILIKDDFDLWATLVHATPGCDLMLTLLSDLSQGNSGHFSNNEDLFKLHENMVMLPMKKSSNMILYFCLWTSAVMFVRVGQWRRKALRELKRKWYGIIPRLKDWHSEVPCRCMKEKRFPFHVFSSLGMSYRLFSLVQWKLPFLFL